MTINKITSFVPVKSMRTSGHQATRAIIKSLYIVKTNPSLATIVNAHLNHFAQGTLIVPIKLLPSAFTTFKDLSGVAAVSDTANQALATISVDILHQAPNYPILHDTAKAVMEQIVANELILPDLRAQEALELLPIFKEIPALEASVKSAQNTLLQQLGQRPNSATTFDFDFDKYTEEFFGIGKGAFDTVLGALFGIRKTSGQEEELHKVEHPVQEPMTMEEYYDPERILRECGQSKFRLGAMLGVIEQSIATFTRIIVSAKEALASYIELPSIPAGQQDMSIEELNIAELHEGLVKKLTEDSHHFEKHLQKALVARQALLDAGAERLVDPLSTEENVQVEQEYKRIKFIKEYNKAVEHYKKEDLDLAVKALEQALEIKPDAIRAYAFLSQIYYKQGQYDLVIETCRRAIAIKPDCAEAYFYLGDAHRKKGEFDLAIEALKKAIEIKPDYAVAHENLKMALAKEEEAGAQRLVEMPREIGALDIEALIAQLHSEDSASIIEAKKKLVEIGQPAVDTLIIALEDEDVAVRAAEALGQIGDIRAVDSLIKKVSGTTGSSLSAAALENKDPLLSEAAMVALGEIGNPKAVEVLLAVLKSKYAYARWAAAESLGKIGDIRAVDLLIMALQEPASDFGAHGRAAEALGKIRDARAVEPLIAALKDKDEKDPFVRHYSARALGQIGDARAVESLIAVLKDKDEDVRSYTAEALGQIGDARAVEPLIAALEDKDKYVRCAAAKALGQIGDTRAVDPLIAALESEEKNSFVQISIENTLRRIRLTSTIQELKQRLQINSEDAKVYCDLGFAYWAMFQYDLAIAAYQKALELKPDYAEARTGLEMALAKRREEAEKAKESGK